MKKHMVLGALLLTLGTAAAAGSFLYGHDQTEETARSITLPSDLEPVSQEATADMIAMWKATAASTDYVAPKAPI